MSDPKFSSVILESIRNIVSELFPRMAFTGVYEYSLAIAQSGDFVDARPTASDLGLPGLRRLPFRWTAGISAQLVKGTRVLLSFVNGDPARPFILAAEGPDGGGFLPTTISIDATGNVNLGGATDRVLRSGEAIKVSLSGAIVAGGSGTLTNCVGTIEINPLVEFVPGAAGHGYARVLA